MIQKGCSHQTSLVASETMQAWLGQPWFLIGLSSTLIQPHCLAAGWGSTLHHLNKDYQTINIHELTSHLLAAHAGLRWPDRPEYRRSTLEPPRTSRLSADSAPRAASSAPESVPVTIFDCLGAGNRCAISHEPVGHSHYHRKLFINYQPVATNNHQCHPAGVLLKHGHLMGWIWVIDRRTQPWRKEHLRHQCCTRPQVAA